MRLSLHKTIARTIITIVIALCTTVIGACKKHDKAIELNFDYPKFDSATYQKYTNDNKDFYLLGTEVNSFGLDILKNADNSNLIFSPYALYETLFMLSLGATNDTYMKIAKILYHNTSREEVERQLSAYRVIYLEVLDIFKDLEFVKNPNDLSNRKRVCYHSYFNHLFINDKISYIKSYTDLLNTAYNFPIHHVDFSRYKDIVDSINKWNDMYHDWNNTLQYNDMQAESSILPVSVVRYKGHWIAPYEPMSTSFRLENIRDDYFYVDNKINRVKTMHGHADGEYYHSQEKHYHAVSLSHFDSFFKTTIIMPEQGYSLDAVIHSLDGRELMDILKKLRSYSITLSLPVVKIQNHLEREILERSGLSFDSNDTFEWLSNDQISIDKFVQYASIDLGVSPQESEIHWTIAGNDNSKMPPEMTLYINRPFMIIISLGEYGIPLLMGQFTGIN